MGIRYRETIRVATCTCAAGWRQFAPRQVGVGYFVWGRQWLSYYPTDKCITSQCSARFGEIGGCALNKDVAPAPQPLRTGLTPPTSSGYGTDP